MNRKTQHQAVGAQDRFRLGANCALQALLVRPLHPALCGRVNVVNAHNVIVLKEQLVGAGHIMQTDQVGGLHLPDAMAACDVAGVVAFVMTEHGNAAALRLRLEQLVGLIEVVAHRFLDEDVLARPQGIGRRLRMVARQHHHGIQVGACEHLAVIAGCKPDAAARGDSLQGAGRKIAQRHNLEQVRQLEQMRQVHHLRDHTGADQPNSDPFGAHGFTPLRGKSTPSLNPVV